MIVNVVFIYLLNIFKFIVIMFILFFIEVIDTLELSIYKTVFL
jgi:hypothetical protein